MANPSLNGPPPFFGTYYGCVGGSTYSSGSSITRDPGLTLRALAAAESCLGNGLIPRWDFHRVIVLLLTLPWVARESSSSVMAEFASALRNA